MSTVPGWVARAVAAVVLLAWSALTGVAFWKMPRGFPLGWRFVLHDVLPWVLAFACLGGLFGLRRPAVSRSVLEGLGALGLGAAAGCVVRFSESIPALQISFGIVGGLTLASALALRRAPLPAAAHAASISIGLLLGIAVPEALRAPDPSTLPSGEPVTLPDPPPDDTTRFASRGVLHLDAPGWSVEIDPFFTVESRSPDRGWTSLAPWSISQSTVWFRHGASQNDATARTWWRSDDGRGVVAWTMGDVARLDAAFTLDTPVFTHLATWCRIRIGPPAATVRFSPCGDTAIEVRPSDYPEGRPARFAYLAEDGRFVVAEAATGEKGPFETLCEGALDRGDPLTMSFRHDLGRARITLLDYTAQASTEPSPTAGWGVPQNAILLMREGNSDAGAVLLHVALAATGIGRGWDTVGLAAGTYRNRMTVVLE